MNIVAIGDTHGRKIWKQIVEKEESADKIIFIGDYFDTHDNITPEEQLDNFLDILAYKKANPNKVVLLLGNHDYHYIVEERYSGYNMAFAITFGDEIKKAINEDLIQLAYYEENTLFTHAGVSTNFLSDNRIEYTTPDKLVEHLNMFLKQIPAVFRFVGSNLYGDSFESGPLWIRPKSLIQAGIAVRQVVGHTQHKQIATGPLSNIYFIDCLTFVSQYLSISNDKVEIRSL